MTPRWSGEAERRAVQTLHRLGVLAVRPAPGGALPAQGRPGAPWCIGTGSPPFGRGKMGREGARKPPALWTPNARRKAREDTGNHRKWGDAKRKWACRNAGTPSAGRSKYCSAGAHRARRDGARWAYAGRRLPRVRRSSDRPSGDAVTGERLPVRDVGSARTARRPADRRGTHPKAATCRCRLAARCGVAVTIRARPIDRPCRSRGVGHQGGIRRCRSARGGATFDLVNFRHEGPGQRQYRTGHQEAEGRPARGRRRSEAPAGPSRDARGTGPAYEGVAFGAGRRWVSR